MDDRVVFVLRPHTFICSRFSFTHSIIVAGDGRYYNNEAIVKICRVLAANGVANVWVPQTGIMSTPAVSAAIRAYAPVQGGIILTASHNPGGPGEDFGIKYNLEYGQPAGEDFTDAVRWNVWRNESVLATECFHNLLTRF